MRRLFFGVSVALIVVAAFVVPMPVLSVAPGPTVAASDLVALEEPEGEVTGRMLVTTVALSEVGLIRMVGAWVDRQREVVFRPAVIPPGVDEGDFVDFQRRIFTESGQIATVVGLDRAGVPVDVDGGGARVVEVLDGSPAEEELREGDVITALDGRPISVAADLVAATSQAEAGEEVTLDVVRGDDELEIRLELATVSPLERPALGVVVATVGLRLDLPFGIELEQVDIGGPSAGLMLALTVYDLASADDLTRGRIIAGTGTIDLAGRVGAVGGVRQKVAAARDAGAQVFLAGPGEVDEARAEAAGALEVFAVATIDDAIDALR